MRKVCYRAKSGSGKLTTKSLVLLCLTYLAIVPAVAAQAPTQTAPATARIH
jgi:hypothetical protein